VDCGEGTQRSHQLLRRSGPGSGGRDRILLLSMPFRPRLGIPGLLSDPAKQQSAGQQAIHGGSALSKSFERMLARLLGRGGNGAPGILAGLVPLVEGRIVDAGQFTIDCFLLATATPTSFGSHSRAKCARHLCRSRLSGSRPSR